MAEWQHLCLACKSGMHNGGCCACMACSVTPEPVAPLTRLEIEEAIAHMRATQKRAPKAFSERYSAKLDDLLDQWVTAVLEEAIADTSADSVNDIELPGA